MRGPGQLSIEDKKGSQTHSLLTIATLQLYLLIYNYTCIACYTASLNTVAALLEYPDPDCSIRVSRSFLTNGVP